MRLPTGSELGKATAIGLAAGYADLTATTGWMHRELTHRSYRLPKQLSFLARTVIWGTGTKPRVWAAVHRDHHDYADTPGDPHSPVMQGRFGVAKILATGALKYRKYTETKTDDVMPQDLQPDKLDKRVFDKVGVGLLTSLAGHAALNKAVGNPASLGIWSFVVEKVGYVTGGNFVNGIGHGGQHPWKAVVTGEIEPFDDGTYGADSVSVGLVTFGEGMQRAHHQNPGSPFFGDRENLDLPQQFARDSAGAVIGLMIDHGLADHGQKPIN